MRFISRAAIAAFLTQALVVFGFSAISVSGVSAQALEEIIVTARKREESLQDIPLSVSAFSQFELSRGGYIDLEDISVNTPGMQFNNELAGVRPGRLYSNIRFRGVEGSEFSTLQTASLFVDGIFALQGAQSMSLIDLERIEIIKGPQSALFGRNSFAGAVNYVTTTPSLDEFKGKISADFATYGQVNNAVSVEGPIFEKVALRVGASLYTKGEMYRSSDGGALGEQRSGALFATLYAEPTENFNLKARVYYQEDDDGPEATAFFKGRLNDTCTGTTRPGLDDDGNLITLTPTLFLCGKVPSFGSADAPKVDQNTQVYPRTFAEQGNPDYLVTNLMYEYASIAGFEDAPVTDEFGITRRMTRLSLVGEYTFNNGMILTGTLSYNENKATTLRDFDSTAEEVWFAVNPQAGEDKGFDLRLQSAQEGRLRWLAGVNVYDQEFLTSGSGGILAHTCGIGNFSPDPVTGVFPCTDPLTFPLGQDGGDFVDVSSAYGSASFDITDQLTIDVEGRYQSDKRSDGFTDFSETFDNFLPRLSVSYKPVENVNLYFTGSRGVIPGVLNSNILACTENAYIQPFIHPRTGLPSTSSTCDQFREWLGDDYAVVTPDQYLDSYELGFKSVWMDGRLLLNVGIYTQEWEDSPYQTFVTLFLDDPDGDTGYFDGIPNEIPTFRQVSNSGSSEYSGFELESAFLVNENWSVNFNWTYNDSEFTEFLSSLTSANAVLGNRNIKGNQAARFPEWSWNLSSTYTGRFNADWEWYARGDISYMGEAVAGITNLAILESYSLVNGRFGIEKDGLLVELYVKNLFDEDTWRGGVEFTDFSLKPDPYFGFDKLGIILLPQDKRTAGIRAVVEF